MEKPIDKLEKLDDKVFHIVLLKIGKFLYHIRRSWLHEIFR